MAALVFVVIIIFFFCRRTEFAGVTSRLHSLALKMANKRRTRARTLFVSVHFRLPVNIQRKVTV